MPYKKKYYYSNKFISKRSILASILYWNSTMPTHCFGREQEENENRMGKLMFDKKGRIFGHDNIRKVSVDTSKTASDTHFNNTWIERLCQILMLMVAINICVVI